MKNETVSREQYDEVICSLNRQITNLEKQIATLKGIPYKPVSNMKVIAANQAKPGNHNFKMKIL